MAYDKTERFSKLIIQTPPDIGPGTYDIIHPRCTGNLGNYPFLSGTKRQTLLLRKDAIKFPGPDNYDLNDPYRHITESNPGGVSIDYTDIRLKPKIFEGPGPAEKDVFEEPLEEFESEHPSKGSRGKLWLMKPPQSIIPSGLSVPTKNDSNGYDYDERGLLVKNPPKICKSAFFYNIPRQEANFNSLRYKGNSWSKMTGRSSPTHPGTPGPGYYEHERQKTLSQIRVEKTREINKTSAKQLRFLDILWRKNMRENFPAPNSYYRKGIFEKYLKVSCKCNRYYVEPPPFGQTAKRFKDEKNSVTPGPGDYEVQVRKKFNPSINPPTFGDGTVRDQKLSYNTGPAPGDYDINVGNLAYESAKRFKCNHVKPVPYISFNKQLTLESESDSETIIPSHSAEKKRKKSSVYHSVFKSRTARFPGLSKGG